MTVLKFSETQPKSELEENRQQLKVGDKFTVTGFVVQPSEKFKDGICKINGLSLKDGTVVKFWTTAQAIHTQLKTMGESVGMDSGALKTNVGAQVYEKKSATGRMYLTFGDIE